jgi:DNA topoisomerase-3
VFDNAKVSDHHAILPTLNRAPVDKMSPDERALFDMLARRSIAAFYPPYEYDQVRVVTEAEGESFRSTGRSERAAGWKAVYRDSQAAADKKDAEAALPALAEGDRRTVEKATVKKESTKPPAPHTDASLLSAMENAGRELDDEALREQMKGSGLGTPATRAAIIDRLIQVGYVQRRGKTLTATDKGVDLIAVAPEELSSAETTGRWELALDRITDGSQDAGRFLDSIRKFSAYLVDNAKNSAPDMAFPEEERRGGRKRAVKPAAEVKGAMCPVCGKGKVTENSRSFYCSRYKEGCAFTLWKDGLTRGGGPLLTAKLIQLLLEKKQVRGSTGVIALTEKEITFTPTGEEAPTARRLLTWQKTAEADKKKR